MRINNKKQNKTIKVTKICLIVNTYISLHVFLNREMWPNLFGSLPLFRASRLSVSYFLLL